MKGSFAFHPSKNIAGAKLYMGIDGFSIGPLYVRFYGIVIMLGAVAGGLLARREAKRRGHARQLSTLHIPLMRFRYGMAVWEFPVQSSAGPSCSSFIRANTT